MSETSEAKSPVWAWNEWDPLEEVIVGSPDNAVVPKLLPEVKACIEPKKWGFYENFGGRRWEEALGGETWHRLVGNIKELVNVLQQEGVVVQRPDSYDFGKLVKTPDYESTGMYCAMPRDNILIVGNEIIEAPMSWRSRSFEYKCYRRLILDYWKKGAVWTMPPKPEYNEKLYNSEYQQGSGENMTFATTEYEPCFDAADFIRAGRDLFVQRSQVTNESGIEWLRRHLKPKGINIHRLNFIDPRPMHIDATFSIPKPGHVFQNPDRPCKEIQFFKSRGWHVHDVPAPKVSKDVTLWLGSKWLSMNTLMLDEKRVLVERDEIEIQKLFEKIGVQSIRVPMKHAYSIGGGIHCWTCDIRRNGILESYF